MAVLEPAALVLADGTAFRGRSVGARGIAAGEVVFNTAMTGYQEILTDPSYCRQIVTLTYPHIGNTGTNFEDEESQAVYAAGLVVRDVPPLMSSWRAQRSLSDYLVEKKVVALADIDTRKLTRILREQGAQNGCLMAGDVEIERALREARAFPGLAGMDLAKSGHHRHALRMERGPLGTRRRLPQAGKSALSGGRLRLWNQAEHPAPSRRARSAAYGGAGTDAGARRAAHAA